MSGRLPDPASLRVRLVEAIGVLVHEGLIDAFGHISARLPGTDLALIPGHTHLEGKHIGQLTPEDILTIDFNGEVVEGHGEPPGERFIHTAVYQARPDVGAVVHVHPPMAIAFSVAGRPILPVWTQGSIFAPAVPMHDYPAQIDTTALGREVAASLGRSAALLLRAHGAVTVGESVQEACVVAVNLERNASIQWRAAVLGTARPIEDRYLEDGMMKGVSRAEYVHAYWEYYVQRTRDAWS